MGADSQTTSFTTYNAQKVSRLCFCEGLVDSISAPGKLPPIAAAGWDSLENDLVLYSPSWGIAEGGDGLSDRDRMRDGSSISLSEERSLKQIGSVTAMKYFRAKGMSFILTGHSGGDVSLVELASSIDSGISLSLQKEFEKLHQWSVTDLDVVEGGKQFVSAGEGGKLKHVDLESGKITSIDADGAAINSVRFLNSSLSFVSASDNPSAQLKVWDLRSGCEAQNSLTLQDDSVAMYTCLALHPTRPELLATGSSDGLVSLWDLRKAGKLSAAQMHQAAVQDLTFYWPSQSLISCGMDGLLVHWNLQSSAETAQFDILERSPLPFNSVDVNAEAQSAVVGGDDHSIRVVQHI